MGRALLIMSLLTSSACLTAELVPCEDGRICPKGLACDEAHGSCVNPDQLEQCRGLAQEAPCITVDVPSGKCFEGVCLPGGCGNGRIEIDEMCEPGISPSGRCSLDCSSTEVCGNGVLDLGRGEICDDMNLVSRDGCSSLCRPEVATWINSGAAMPQSRSGAAAAYDATNREVVLFGGLSGSGMLGDTWLWREGAWHAAASATGSPSPRAGAAMTYDPIRRRVVLFGGRDDDSALNDTWEWDGSTWMRSPIITSPGQRGGHALAFDPISKRVLLFGGASGYLSDRADTWAWDGQTWTQLVSGGLTARNGHAMALDPIRGRIVLFGGSQQAFPTTVVLTDTWEWTGTVWEPIVTSTVPTSAGSPEMAFDPIRRELVMFDTNTWAFDGSDWRSSTGSTPSRTDHTFAFDIDGGVGVATGGAPGGADTWLWNGVVWSAWTPPATPGARTGRLVFDRAKGVSVLIGGSSGHTDRRTWTWSGSRWSQTSPTVTPEPLVSTNAVYDAARQQVITFGGVRGTYIDETWAWDGTSWTELQSTTRPSARAYHAMAYDEKRGATVLFGGAGATSGELSDTWERGSGDWAQVTTLAGPSSRLGAAMAYDRTRQRTVLFGGNSRSGLVVGADTWEWDGEAWVERMPAQSPRPRSGHSMVFDPRRGRVVLFGGLSYNGTVLEQFSDTWEWDGTTWREVPTDQRSPTLVSSASAYDEVRAEIVAFGTLVFMSGVGNARAMLSFGSEPEQCVDGIDSDGDGEIGCADADCGWACEPMCPLGTSCSTEPRCGDGTCAGRETGLVCPTDCGPPAPICGDWRCDPSEAPTSCTDC